MGNKNKPKKKSAFKERLDKMRKRKHEEELSPDDKKQLGLAKLEKIFNTLGNKENRYLFYCPDMPFASTLGKTIYEFAYLLQEAGFTTRVLHEQHGFKPTWLKEPWAKNVNIEYVMPEPKKKQKKKKAQMPSYKFKPTDTIILPEGFWSLAEGFKEIKPVTKVILALGYGGMITAEPGMDWSFFGFTDVICLSEKLKDDYKSLWPHFTYHVVNYSIDTEQFKPKPINEIPPTIALSIRNREDAQELINIFYNRYPYLDMFDFKVLKKLDTKQYGEALRDSCCLVFVDEKAGHPAPPLEATACGIPTIAVFGRGMEHLGNSENFMWVNNNDMFILAEMLAQFCLTWLQSETKHITDKKILKPYVDRDKVKDKLKTIFDDLQEKKIQTFVAVKNSVEKGELNYESDDSEEQDENNEGQLKVVKDEENK